MFDLFFITSNNEKLAHARYICRNYRIRILKKKNYGVGYEEPRIKDRKTLLEQSILDAADRFQKNVSNPDEKFFFIEDTSVIIEALSQNGEEVPGVDIKYWMRENSFEDVDELLIEHQNRRVKVRSDIVLWLPLQYRTKDNPYYLHFHDEVEGEIISQPLNNITTQPYYPWLNDKNFNKWFVPDGATMPLSKLNINEANKYDFRKKAFDKMLDFLEKKGIISKKSASSTVGTQLGFSKPPVFIICGATCSGKTTIARYLQEHFIYYHIEASDFMYLNFYERHGAMSKVSIGDFALEALHSNKRIVVDRILDHIKKMKYVPLVITGFRAPEEVEEFKAEIAGKWSVAEVWIDAEFSKRFERSVNRGRHDKVLTKADFKSRDDLQDQMGLQKIKEKLNEANIINNNYSFDAYYESFESRFTSLLSFHNPTKIIGRRRKLEIAILKALLATDQKGFYTTTEITRLINSLEEYSQSKKNKNNVSRYFNQDYHPYYEIKLNTEGKLTYRLTNTGISLATWFTMV